MGQKEYMELCRCLLALIIPLLIWALGQTYFMA